MTVEERLNKLELENDRLRAVVECQNLISTYVYYHAANMNDECVELFAKSMPDTAVDIPHIGVFEGGIDAIRRCYSVAHNMGATCEDDWKGMMMVRPLTTPLIQVAGDCKTAQGVWISPGVSTGGDEEHGYTANWAWLKYGCDFIREEDGWKIWHLRVFGIFMTPFDKSWVESAQEVPDPEEAEEREKMMEERRKKMPAEALPDRTNDHYDWTYAPDRVYPRDMPTPPVPYETWDDAQSMMDMHRW